MNYKEKVIALLKSQELSKEQKEKLEDIFPELAESDDERIRKNLIACISTLKHPLFSERERKEFIAWLEKQGDTNEIVNKKRIAPDILRGAAINLITWIDYNVAEGNMCLSDMECKRIEDALVNGDWGKIYAYMKRKLEKQCEQKLPVEKLPFEMKTPEESLGIDSDTYSKIVNECVYGEQNPADKSKIKPKFKTGDRVIGVVSGMPYFITEVCDDHYNTESGCIIMFCAQDNFELYEQKLAEWSEWDRILQDSSISYLCNLRDTFEVKKWDKEQIQKCINWLKSLKPQATWKPSDEQMEYLAKAIATLGEEGDCKTASILNDLRVELKKLRGE